MPKLPARLRRYLRDAARAFERAPVEVVLALVVAGAFSYAVEAGDAFRSWFEIAAAAALAGTAAWTGTLLHALEAWTARRRWLATAVGLGLATAYGATVLRTDLEAELWRAGTLVAAAAAWILAIPVAARGSTATDWADDATLRVRRIDGRFLVRAVGASLYAGALFAGLALALAAVDSLFELEMDRAIYAHLFGWLAFALVPWIVAGGVTDYVRAERDTDGIAATLHRLSAYLVVPLIAVYYLILYAYAIRIGVTGELPENLVSPLVLAAGGLGVTTLLLFDPRPDDPHGRRALAAIAPLFLPLGVLGAWAVGLRVDQYGWTEFRYLRFAILVALFALALGGTIQLWRRRRLTLHAVPLVLAGVLLLSAVGPWGALAVSRDSQQTRLAAALEAADLLRDGRLADPDVVERRTVPNSVYDDIASTTRYLNDHFGRDALRAVMPVDELDEAALRDLAAHFGLRREGRPDAPGLLHARFAPGTAVPGPGGGTIHRVTLTRSSNDTVAVAVMPEPDSLVIRMRVDGTDLFADLDPVARWIVGSDDPRAPTSLPADLATVDAVDAEGVRRGRLLILDVALHRPDDLLEPLRLDGLLLLEPRGG